MNNIISKNVVENVDENKLKQLIGNANYIPTPSITISGIEVDKISTTVIILSIITWIFIWFKFNIFNVSRYGVYIFVGYIIYCISQIFLSDVDININSSRELDKLVLREEFIQSGLNIFILFFVFIYAIKIPETQRNNIYKIQSILIFLTILSVILTSSRHDPVQYKILRKIKGSLYNKSIFLFLLCFIVLIENYFTNNS